MFLVPSESALRAAFPLLAGIVLGVGSLYFLAGETNTKENFEELALGEENTAAVAELEGVQVHCLDLDDVDRCLDSYQRFGSRQEIVLWLGNSQVHTINQMQAGDVTASVILHRYLERNSKYFLTFSQPNANLQEHYLLFEYLSRDLPV